MDRSESLPRSSLPLPALIPIVEESIFPDLTSQPSNFMAAQEVSQSQSMNFHGIDLRLTPKPYKNLTQEDCILMVSESIKTILMNTFNDEFRKECFELLKTNSSVESGNQIRTLLTEIGSDKSNKNNSIVPIQAAPLMVQPLPGLPDLFSSNDNVWAVPPTPVPGSPCGPQAGQRVLDASILWPPENRSPAGGYNFGAEVENADPYTGFDYNAIAESINQIFSQQQSQSVQAQQSTRRENESQNCSNDLFSGMHFHETGAEDPIQAPPRTNYSADPGSPSLLPIDKELTNQDIVTTAFEDAPTDFRRLSENLNPQPLRAPSGMYFNETGVEDQGPSTTGNSVDPETPPGSPSLLPDDVESSGIEVTNLDIVTIAFEDEPTDFQRQSENENRQLLMESQPLLSNLMDLAPLERIVESQTDSCTPEDWENKVDCSQPETLSEFPGLAYSMERDASQGYDGGSQNKIRSQPSQEFGRTPLSQIQNRISNTPPASRLTLLQSLRSTSPS